MKQMLSFFKDNTYDIFIAQPIVAPYTTHFKPGKSSSVCCDTTSGNVVFYHACMHKIICLSCMHAWSLILPNRQIVWCMLGINGKGKNSFVNLFWRSNILWRCYIICRFLFYSAGFYVCFIPCVLFCNWILFCCVTE